MMVAPIIVGLNDSEIPAILQAGKEAGAVAAGYQLLTQPLKEEAVLSKIKSTRDGKMNDATFSRRMSGQGVFAEQVKSIFQLFQRKFGFSDELPARDCTKFEPPLPESGQLRLF
jgi:DNA repair photolyase